MSTVLTKLREVADQVTTAERRACEFILENPDFVREHSLNEVATAADSSEATIIRLCRKVDLKGYRDLRTALAVDHAIALEPAIHEDVLLDDTNAELLSKVFAAFANALTDTLGVVDVAMFSDAVDAMGAAKSISFFGFGASGATAQSAHFRFMRLGTPCYVLTDVSAQLSRVALMGAGDVVVVISHSGRTKDLLYAVENAHARGATVIAITQYGQNPLGTVADFQLCTSSLETAFRSEAMASQVAQHALLDALFVAVSLPNARQVTAVIDEHHRLTAALYNN